MRWDKIRKYVVLFLSVVFILSITGVAYIYFLKRLENTKIENCFVNIYFPDIKCRVDKVGSVWRMLGINKIENILYMELRVDGVTQREVYELLVRKLRREYTQVHRISKELYNKINDMQKTDKEKYKVFNSLLNYTWIGNSKSGDKEIVIDVFPNIYKKERKYTFPGEDEIYEQRIFIWIRYIQKR